MRLNNVTVRYGELTAVDAVDLTLADGEILALLGPSGCGKSTLLRAVAGLVPLDEGDIEIDGRSLAGVPVHKRQIGLVFQDGQLFEHRTVAGNIAYGLAGRPRAEVAGLVDELLNLVGLAGYGDRPTSTLSGGQAQRVALARSLAPSPAVLLLDEPLSALDRALREHLSTELRQILKRAGVTSLYVTHDHDEAFAVADRVALMNEGQIVRVATPHELLAHPGEGWAGEFLDADPIVPATVIDSGASSRLTIDTEVTVPERLAAGEQVELRVRLLKERADERPSDAHERL
ncbi:MAG: ABC transporter ATP-binding protein [Flaviflexus sp.]|nr:ABC transporter ATP-binding protein [Flaviflexus sp.]